MGKEWEIIGTFSYRYKIKKKFKIVPIFLYIKFRVALCLCVLKYLESLTKLVSIEAKLVKFYSWPFFSLCSSVTLAAPDMRVDHTTLCSCQCPHLSDYPFSFSLFPTFDNKFQAFIFNTGLFVFHFPFHAPSYPQPSGMLSSMSTSLIPSPLYPTASAASLASYIRSLLDLILQSCQITPLGSHPVIPWI